ncbi:protein of unknown function DUF1555 [Rippkaea orientalis PCC 8801]|uniref:Abnormal spindle-like microcephaly-associated protein ASH domain-containing protein n=1 Tax=Rippkaea orientalis (strain PCC 8801 / RF-1) TaxID=41431 RepID=B7JUS5_RIPO1|nr:choice-of-anchor D domain-containing protein [Rippkaea orientalis]ACK65619.1 protein of unknown function DUF1555 [Rippkaea orientalis PCC 8801]
MKVFVPNLPLGLLTVSSILGISSQVLGATLTLNATNAGSYRFNGTSSYTQTSTSSYVTGRTTNPQENRSYFVFTIPSSMSQSNRTILGATLTLVNPTNGSGANLTGKTLNITNFTGNINNLISNGGGTNAGRQTVFNDLGTTGTGNVVYGSTTFDVLPTSPISINLSQNSILTDIRNRAGQQFAIGAALTGLNTTNNQSVFVGSSSATPSNRQLTITYADAFLGTNGDQQFGNVLIGQSASRTLTVTNNGETGSTLTGLIGASTTSTIQPTSGTSSFSLGSTQSSTRTFTYTPTVRGSNQTNIAITSNDTNTNPLLTGIGVAPQNVITSSNLDAGLVRIGTSSTVGVTLQNIGDGNLSGQGAISNLNGTASLTGISSNFIPTAGSVGNLSLTDNVSQNIEFLYTPTAKVAETQELTLAFSNGSDNGTNQAQTKTFALSGTGVGPAFQSGPVPNSTINFGTVPIHSTVTLPFVITNATQDPIDPNNDLSLTGLTLLNAFFEGPDADLFFLSNFTPGTVLARGESLFLDIGFTAGTTGPKNATLRILTDQGAAFGQVGEDFSYNVTALAVPEPSSLLGLGAFLTSGILVKRKRD